MKKKHIKFLILFAVYSLVFLLVLLIINHFILMRSVSREIRQQGEMRIAPMVDQQKIFWNQAMNRTRETGRFIANILAGSPPEKPFSFQISGKSMRAFLEDEKKISSLGIFVSDRNRNHDDVNKVIQGFPLLQYHLLDLGKPFFNTFFVSKDNWIAISPGNWVSELEDEHDLKKDIFYRAIWHRLKPEDSGSGYITDLYYDDIWGSWMIALLVPVYVDNQFMGVAGHNILAESIFRVPEEKRFFEQGNLFLLNQNRELVLHRDLESILQRDDFEMNQRFAFQDEAKDVKARQIVHDLNTAPYFEKEIETGHVSYLVLVRRIPVLNWYQVYTLNKDELESPLEKRSKLYIAAVFIAFLFFVLGLFFYFFRRIVRPIKSISLNLDRFQSTGMEEVDQKKKPFFSPLDDLFVNIENVFTRLSSDVREIEESKEYIETLMKTVQIFIMVFNKKLKPIYMNDYALKKLEIRKEDISTLNLFHYIEKKFLKEIAREFDESDNILNRETSMLLNKGKRIDVNISLSKLLNVSGELIGYIAVVDDVTKRKKAETNLKNQIAFSRQIFKSIPDMIFIVDTRLKIVFYNQKAGRIIEKSSSSERNISYFLSEKAVENGFDESLRNMINNGEYIKQINVMNPFKEGFNYVDLIIEPLKSTSGIIGGLIIMRDISEWRNLTEKIKNLQEFMGRLIDASPYAVISINENDQISLWNQAAEMLFGEPGDRVMNRNLFEVNPFFLSYKDIINEVKIVKKTFSLSDQKMDFERESPAVLNLNFYSVQSDGRNVVINIEDMSKIRKLEDSLLQAQKMESLGLLTSGIIHDFNNILSGIIGYASLLDKKVAPDSEMKKYSSNIIDYSEKASSMIKQVLGFSKKRLSKKEVLDLNLLMVELLNFLKVSLKNIKIVRELSGNRIQLFVDKTKLSQVIINLMINAKEALEKCAQPEIRVSTEEVFIKNREDLLDGPYAKIKVSDNGSGIKKEMIGKIFEPFFSTKDKEKSTGLGLAMVKDIIKDFNGAIDVESEFEKGTTFSILIPVVKEELYETQEEIKKKVETAIEGAILLVDDELVIREIGEEMLKSLGIKCFTAANGDEAVRIFTENSKEIKLVILDIEMPGLSGDQVAESLQKIEPNIKILFSSGYTRDYLESKVFKEKIIHFIPKPFHLDQLSDKLNMLMRES
jgi:two-component system cell cycle sensor histidine kinase/response regulator CckA